MTTLYTVTDPRGNTYTTASTERADRLSRAGYRVTAGTA